MGGSALNRPVIPVAAGCVINERGDVLICQRPAGKIAAGKWEFPGGKIEAGETSRQALDRELHEELGLRVRDARPLICVTHDYSDRRVVLHTWRVSGYDGELRPHDGQAMTWVRCEDLYRHDLLAADRPIVSALRLPSHYVFTSPAMTESECLAGLERLPDKSLLRLRLPMLDEPAYERCARTVIEAARLRALSVILDREPQQVIALGAAGWHASTARLRMLKQRPLPVKVWFFASCHTAADIECARRVDADAAVAGPLAMTPSHPGRPGMGWRSFKELAGLWSRPLYAIGGVGPSDLSVAHTHGAQGVAGIRAYWGGGASVTTMGSSVETR